VLEVGFAAGHLGAMNSRFRAQRRWPLGFRGELACGGMTGILPSSFWSAHFLEKIYYFNANLAVKSNLQTLVIDNTGYQSSYFVSRRAKMGYYRVLRQRVLSKSDLVAVIGPEGTPGQKWVPSSATLPDSADFASLLES
jgi:hypothetical protein